MNTIKFIISHPLNRKRKIKAIFGYFNWQLRSKIYKKPFVHKFTQRSRLFISKGETGATGNLYCGLHEFDDMSFLLHMLRSDDLFVDIGANIGSYTVLASAEVGAKSITIEPIPTTFQRLLLNIDLNKIADKVQPLNMAVGNSEGFLRFTQSYDTINHVATEQESNTINIPVHTLDNILKGKSPVLMKIDVEGFETEVINGAESILKNNQLKAIIIELNQSGLRYGYDDINIHNKLISHGFIPYNYDPFKRILTEKSLSDSANMLYIRDLNEVTFRIKNANKIKICSQEY